MILMKRPFYWSQLLLLISIVIGLFAGESYASTVSEKYLIKIGAFSDHGYSESIRRWQPTIDRFNQELPQYHFSLIPIKQGEVRQAISQKAISFVFVNPGESIRVGKPNILSWLATLVSPIASGTTQAIASSVWVDKASPYQSIDNLYNKKISAASRYAFGGYLAFAREVKDYGYDNQYFNHIRFVGHPHQKVVQELIDHKTEAIIVPACFMEELDATNKLDISQYRLIHDKTPEGFDCKISTPTYPNWSFAMTPSADRQLAKKIVSILLNIKPDSHEAISAKSLGWTVPESQQALDDLFYDLGMHPESKTFFESIALYYAEYKHLAWFLLILFLFLPLYHIYLTIQFRKSQREKSHLTHILQTTQKKALVGKLGGNLAHEMNQPLGAIRLYAESGIAMLAKKGSDQGNKSLNVLIKILKQLDRTEGVINRYRSVLRSMPIEKVNFDLVELLKQTIEMMDWFLSKNQVDVYMANHPFKCQVFADKIAIQQVIVNILSNAVEASNQSIHSRVEVTLDQYDDRTLISVHDSGPGFSKEKDKLFQPFVTSKQQEGGLGLGLSICEDIISSHKGMISLENHDKEGGVVTIILPKLDD